MVNIWMMTVGIELKTQVSLYNLARYLDIDDTLVGIKYKYLDKIMLKGTYTVSKLKENKLFSNQVSIAMVVDTRNINIKVFTNGTLHITGVNNESQILKVKDYLLDRIKELHNKTDTLILESSVPYINSDGILFNSSGTRNIGMVTKDKLFLINNRKFKFYPEYNFFININNLYTKEVLDLDGNLLGTQKLVTSSGTKRIYTNGNQLYSSLDGVFVGTKLIGTFEYNFPLEKAHTQVSEPTSVQYPKYPFDRLINSKEYTKENILYYNISVNYRYSEERLPKQRILEFVESNGYIVNRDLQKSSKVNLTYKDNSTNTGKCNCEFVCICNNITVFIFETGKVNIYGIKDINKVNTIVNSINKLIKCEIC